MDKKFKLTPLAIFIIVAVAYFLSWAITVGFIYLITLCFGLEFKLITATGLWLVICLLRGIFGGASKG